jgi:polyhydroxyalkanoate synthesis repressor PhaR
MIREGREFEVLDAKSGEDITHQVLTQIIVDEESRGSTMLPVNFLRQLIGLYGGSMQGAVPAYLDAAMDAFKTNQNAMRDALTANPLADLAKRNMAMFEEATSALRPKPRAAPADAETSEIEKLRAELASLQAKVDRLVG